MAYKIISKKISYRGMWACFEKMTLELPNGKVAEWENLISDDTVAIVALDEDKNIYLSKEWRSAWEKEILQIPAGLCKQKTEKGILQQAHNELREEIGLDAKNWQKLGTFLWSGRQRTKVHFFLAQNLYESKKDPDENEIIEVVKVPFVKACRDFFSGKIPTVNYSLAGISLAKERLKL